ncbi:MAG: nuclear transport factor 2 family protein [Polyangiaceae bacterium]
MSSEVEAQILKANEDFYRAFTRRDLPAMTRLWSVERGITCIHPGWSVLRGRARVMESWRGILANPDSPPVRCVEPRVSLLGDTALVICFEVVDGSRLIATNVFVREAEAWLLVHHQAGPVARPPSDPPPPDPTALN